MNALKALFIIILGLALCVCSFQFGQVIEKARTKEDSHVHLASTEYTLTKWVYDKSDRISLDTAKAITKEALKTERPLLMLALVSVESEFVESSASRKGAIGLTQIMPIHTKALIEAKIIKDRRDLYGIEPSIRAGNFILNGFLIRTNGNVQKALELYLGGKDGAYTKRILGNLADLYILTGENKK